MAFDLVVFDWDGTLMDSTASIATSIQSACRDLHLPIPSEEAAKWVIGLGLADALKKVVPGIDPTLVPQMVARYRHHYLSSDHTLQLFDGVKDLLNKLQAHPVHLAVATGKSRIGLERAFETSGLRAFFGASRCADETEPKPSPRMLIELMQCFDVKPARVLMVGDTTHDLEMARAAGCAGIGVDYGAHPHQQLAPLASHGVVSSVDELSARMVELLEARA